MKSYYPKSLSELKNILKDHTPGIFFGSRTSTVIPGELALEKMAHIYLGELEKRIEIKKNSVVITGPVTWEELHRELQFDQQALFPSPTDWTAQVLASLSTSASGEMNFSKGNLRDKVYRIKYLDFNGDEKVLSSGQSLNIDHPRLSQYKKSYQEYESFKNAPFPRLEKETDLMIGTEGQLGVIVEAEIKTSKNPEAIVLALSLKSWTENFDELIKLIALMRNNRALIQFCEFIDKDSLSFVDDSRLEDHKDYLFLKVLENDIETAQKILDEREGISILTEGQFNSLRVEVPRKVNETLSRKNLTKKGTDIQVTLNDLDKLLVFYQNLKKKFPDSYLFGHAGDCHFHFNIVADDQKRVDLAFDELYKKIKALHCSPFAEHGIGVLKKKYLRDFLSKEHLEIFSYLKKLYDPHNQFFPDGYMSLPLEKEKS